MREYDHAAVIVQVMLSIMAAVCFSVWQESVWAGLFVYFVVMAIMER